MIPDNQQSSVPVPGAFAFKQNLKTVPLIDYEIGGQLLNDSASAGDDTLWQLEYIAPDFVVSHEATGEQRRVIFSQAGVTEVSLAFDQSMRTMIAFTTAAGSFYRWYDPVAEGMVISQLPAGCNYPRVSKDDSREEFTSTSDVILSYVRGTNLCIRVQRERYEVEHIIDTNSPARLVNAGMSVRSRFQWRLTSN